MGPCHTSRRYREIRERAVRLVFEHQDEYPSQWAAIRSIAEKSGMTSETLRTWVRQAERDTGGRPRRHRKSPRPNDGTQPTTKSSEHSSARGVRLRGGVSGLRLRHKERLIRRAATSGETMSWSDVGHRARTPPAQNRRRLLCRSHNHGCPRRSSYIAAIVGSTAAARPRSSLRR